MNTKVTTYELDGEQVTVQDVADRFGIPRGTIYWRLASGMTMKDAVEKVSVDEKDIKRTINSPDELNDYGCRLLAMGVLRQSYMDCCEGEVLKLIEEGWKTKRLNERMKLLADQCYRAAKLAEKHAKTEWTEEDLQGFVVVELGNRMADIRSRAETAERFLMSDRAMLFTQRMQPRYFADLAKERVWLWANGKIPAYRPHFCTGSSDGETDF